MRSFTYKAGAASVCITPDEPLWLAGYAARTAPARGKISDLYASALAIGRRNGAAIRDRVDWTSSPSRRSSPSRSPTAALARHGLARASSFCSRRRTRTTARNSAPTSRFSSTFRPSTRRSFPTIAEQTRRGADASDRPGTRTARAGATVRTHDDCRFCSQPPPAWRRRHGTPVRRRRHGRSRRARARLRRRDRQTQGDRVRLRLPQHDDPARRSAILRRLGRLRQGAAAAGQSRSDGAISFPAPAPIRIRSRAGRSNSRDNTARKSRMPCSSRSMRRDLRSPARFAPNGKTYACALEPVTHENDRTNARERRSAAAREGQVSARPARSRRAADHVVCRADPGRAIRQRAASDRAQRRAGGRLGTQVQAGSWSRSGAAAPAPSSSPLVWVAGYCNDMFGYVPTRRVQAEGGYEGGRANLWSWIPAPFTDDVEDRITDCRPSARRQRSG